MSAANHTDHFDAGHRVLGSSQAVVILWIILRLNGLINYWADDVSCTESRTCVRADLA